jgi:hypothetical protein
MVVIVVPLVDLSAPMVAALIKTSVRTSTGLSYS